MHYLTIKCIEGFLPQIEHVKYAKITFFYNKILKIKCKGNLCLIMSEISIKYLP